MLLRKIVCNNLSSLSFHIEADKPTCCTYLQYTLPFKIHTTNVFLYALAKVPLSLNMSIAWNIHRVIKKTLIDVCNYPWGRIYITVYHIIFLTFDKFIHL